jgi:hypothetical protein
MKLVSQFIFVFVVFLFGNDLVAQKSKLNVVHKNGIYSVEILDENNNALLKTPSNGLWAIATSWENNWMSNWYYGNPDTIEKTNGYTILSGKIRLAEGDMLVRDAYFEEEGRVKCIRRFSWKGEKPLNKATLSVQFLAEGIGEKILMPGILYYGNPAGKRSKKTPFYDGKVGDMAFYEEHRFPMPFVSFEWGNKSIYGAALHSLPSPVPFGNLMDQWWSLGVQTKNEGTLLTLLSGACASNGEKSVIKAFQGKGMPSMFANYDNAYLNIPLNGIVEKEFYLEAYPVARNGSGFQKSVQTALAIFKVSADGLPKFNQIIKDKYTFAKNRWIEGKNYAGFNQFDTHLQKYSPAIVLGWVGQAAAPGYAFQYLQDEVQDKSSLEMAQKSLDFVSTTKFYPEGFYTWYHIDKQTWGTRIWKENPEILSQGQCMFNMANAIKASDKSGLNPEKWKTFLKKAADFHSKRILSNSWNPISTDEAFFIAPLCMASSIFDEPKYKEAAIKAGEVYAKRSLEMKEVYWGGTLDANGEDKEGAFGAFQGFLALYELTGEDKYLEWAKHAGDVTLSYTMIWDIELPAGRLRDHNFKTRGWTAVSVQNMHIDVYGVLIAPFVYKLGKYTNNENLKKIAKIMYLSCGQLIDPYGSQGEQPQQTNYSQASNLDSDITSYRGNYVEDWTVFWITAHFLNGAAMFKEMGVEFD